ncbi:hypothetical protein [Acinetobacter tibetensis]|uniref:Uncharacterized protein n=1 Tax=Acinetobacter tibetensis TaxID=2943497 RepID=A0AAE9LTC8_9GAMM|nr:hypothetical protein [Acinetobacter tibetensis]USE84348.1 hypothetical protein M5E07_05990 [Acinetobacter tibetensis]
MLKLFVFMIFASCSISSVLASPKNNTDLAIHEQNCLDLADAASAIMEARQGGSSLLEMMKIANMEEDSGKRFIIKTIVADSFKKPKMQEESKQKDVINEFSANYYLACTEMYK